tara:strand:+ start:9489 stop:9647 length:159 start_codon:yes stop_codon:yes gene_type:complete
MNLFISKAIWKHYALQIALEDLVTVFGFVDEEIITDKSINTNECSESEYLLK